MIISKRSVWLNKRELFWVILLPVVVQIFFPRFWFEPFLIVLFLFAWDGRVFSFFVPVLIWSIIKSFIAGENAGTEMMALGAVWYFLNFFPFSSRIEKTSSVFAGSLLFLFIKVIAPGFKSIWSNGMFFKFFLFFALMNLVICWVIYSVRNYCLDTDELWKIV